MYIKLLFYLNFFVSFISQLEMPKLAQEKYFDV